MQLKKKHVAVAVVQAVAFMGAGVALAQDAQRVERVEITGSAIKRIESEAALPVQVLTRKDIERSGATSVPELIQKLPAVQGFTEASISVGGGGGGLSSASLRGLGAQRTLVLLNGRRMAPYAGQTLTGYGDGIDLNLLPLASIERVEILTDGASTLYGSDAVGGVINFITKNTYTGIDIAGQYIKPEKSGATEYSLSASAGFGDLKKDGYNVMLALAHNDREQLRADQRDFSRTGIISFGYNGQTYDFFNGSSRSIPGNIRPGAADSALGARNPYFMANGKCPERHVTIGRQCFFDYASTLEIYPEMSRTSGLLTFNKALAGGHTLFGEMLYAESKLISRIAAPPVDIPIATTSPFYSVPASLGYTDNVTVRWRMWDAGNRTTENTGKALHLVAGAKGSLAGWDYGTSLTHSTNEWRENHLAGWLKSNELLAALSAGTLNPFVEPGKQSAAGMNTINSAVNRGTYKAADTGLTMLDLKASRELFSAPGGAAMVAVGADFRRESNSYSPSAIAQGIGNNIAGDSGAEKPFDLSRNAYGAFAEVAVPLSKTFELTGAVRGDHYSDIGGTFNYKLAGRWQPTSQWLVRGSVGTGFKAPSLAQVSNIRQLYGVTAGSYACPFAATDPMARYCVPGSTQYNVFAEGTSGLKPEKSQQFSLGVRFEPSPMATLGVDFWAINVKDRITQLDESAIFGNPTTYRHLFTTYTDPTSGSTDLAILQKNENLGKQQVSGLDFDLALRFKTPMGQLTSQVLATYMLKSKYQREAGGAYYSDLGYFNDGAVTFRTLGRWINTLEYGKWTHSATINYKSGYADQFQSAEDCLVSDANGDCVDIRRQVKAYLTADWQTTYQHNKNLRLTLGVLNLLDQDPPLSIKTVGGHQLGYDNRYTDPRGRTFYGRLNYSFK
ncbi:MAG: TonB-dependent receptor [Burkholderiales bacterium]|nr:TonB-dependent receptor [Burkholderiales bacterium]